MDIAELEVMEWGRMRDRRGRVVTTVEERARLVAEYERSGLTQRRFAEREGLNYFTFVSWVHKARLGRSRRLETGAGRGLRRQEANANYGSRGLADRGSRADSVANGCDQRVAERTAAVNGVVDGVAVAGESAVGAVEAARNSVAFTEICLAAEELKSRASGKSAAGSPEPALEGALEVVLVGGEVARGSDPTRLAELVRLLRGK